MSVSEKYRKFYMQAKNRIHGTNRARVQCNDCRTVWFFSQLKSDRVGYFCPYCRSRRLEKFLDNFLEAKRFDGTVSNTEYYKRYPKLRAKRF